jgi:hypothetical protein
MIRLAYNMRDMASSDRIDRKRTVLYGPFAAAFSRFLEPE